MSRSTSSSEELRFGWGNYAESWNGRLAMIGSIIFGSNLLVSTSYWESFKADQLATFVSYF